MQQSVVSVNVTVSLPSTSPSSTGVMLIDALELPAAMIT